MWAKVEQLVGEKKLAPPPQLPATAEAPPRPAPLAAPLPAPPPKRQCASLPTPPPVVQPTERTTQIQELITQRAIKHVLHFTRMQNMGSIVRHGLVPRGDLSARGIPFSHNDDVRLDGALNASCLTLSWPNYKMFYRYRTANPTVPWVVVSFKPDILWQHDCAFCIENAASNRVRAVALRERKSVGALQSLFIDQEYYPTRAKLGIPAHFPTNPQAEILLFGTLPTQLIQVVLVPSEALAQQFRAIAPTVPTRVSPNAFSPRLDWEFWKPAPSPIGDAEMIF